jgi:hypothetical protein
MRSEVARGKGDGDAVNDIVFKCPHCELAVREQDQEQMILSGTSSFPECTKACIQNFGVIHCHSTITTFVTTEPKGTKYDHA